jgi:hypothetical protein
MALFGKWALFINAPIAAPRRQSNVPSVLPTPHCSAPIADVDLFADEGLFCCGDLRS